MSSSGPDNDRDRFDAAFRTWSDQPPARDAGRAARRVLAALPQQSEPFPWRRLAAAAAVLVLVFLGSWYGARERVAGPGATAVATPALPENVMVFWIDAETPVYFVLSQLGSQKGEPS